MFIIDVIRTLHRLQRCSFMCRLSGAMIPSRLNWRVVLWTQRSSIDRTSLFKKQRLEIFISRSVLWRAYDIHRLTPTPPQSHDALAKMSQLSVSFCNVDFLPEEEGGGVRRVHFVTLRADNGAIVFRCRHFDLNSECHSLPDSVGVT